MAYNTGTKIDQHYDNNPRQIELINDNTGRKRYIIQWVDTS
jgi:hypothetical protein